MGKKIKSHEPVPEKIKLPRCQWCRSGMRDADDQAREMHEGCVEESQWHSHRAGMNEILRDEL